MIRHCVFIHFNEQTSLAQRDELFKELIGLQSHLSGILAIHTGMNVSPETGMDKGFSDGFMVDFADPESRDAYLIDEQHQQLGARLVAAAEGGAAGILVYDLEIVAAE